MECVFSTVQTVIGCHRFLGSPKTQLSRKDYPNYLDFPAFASVSKPHLSWQARNEPAFVRQAAEKMAELKKVSLDEVP